MLLRKHKMSLKQLVLMLFGGFRGIPKKHHSFPFFPDFSVNKYGFPWTFPGISGVLRRKTPEKGVLQRYEQYYKI